MARFYLDENVGILLAVLLRALGHDVVTTDELGNKGATDVRQLLVATKLDRILITHDGRHFGMLHQGLHTWAVEWNVSTDRHPGILVIPTPPRLDFNDAARIATELISAEGSVRNRLFAWERSKGWSEVLV